MWVWWRGVLARCGSMVPLLYPQVSPVPVTDHECGGGEGLLPKSTLDPKHAKQSFPKDYANADSRDCPCFLPVGTLPLIATSCITYQEKLKQVALTTNRVYREFLESEEGQDFSGQVGRGGGGGREEGKGREGEDGVYREFVEGRTSVNR